MPNTCRDDSLQGSTKELYIDSVTPPFITIFRIFICRKKIPCGCQIYKMGTYKRPENHQLSGHVTAPFQMHKQKPEGAG